jgi:hypothetical protein
MGSGAAPGSLDVIDPPRDINDGTLARTESPGPGVIGLDAGSGKAGQSHPIGEGVVQFAQRKSGHHVGDHECFALADQALHSAGASSAADFGTVTPDADYAWGTPISLGDVQAGDVIQFRNYRYDRETTVEDANGGSTTNTWFEERPHHTAVVERVDGNGALTVLEQNSPQGSTVHRTQLFFSDTTTTQGRRTTKISVQGSIWYYRPQRRN